MLPTLWFGVVGEPEVDKGYVTDPLVWLVGSEMERSNSQHGEPI
jgi:hypothetical protein